MAEEKKTPDPAKPGQHGGAGDRSEAEPHTPNDSAGSGSAEDLYPVTLDGVGYKTKPKNCVGAITRRMQRAGASQVTMPELWAHIKSGHTFTCGTFEPCANSWGAFLGQRLFGVDVDNKFGRMELKPGCPGYLSPFQAVERCRALRIAPVLLYFTMSADIERKLYRYRLLFDAGRVVTDEQEADSLQLWLLGKFPEADTQCKNPHTRLWFGAGKCGGWELWTLPREFWKGESR